MRVKSPRVSILLATNRFDDDFCRAVDSCLMQTYTDLELIVVANGVTDVEFSCIVDFCLKSASVRVFRTNLRRLTFSLNLGLHEGLGEYIARMDADDICYPNRIADQVKFLDKYPHISLCGSWCDLMDGERKIVGEWRYLEADAEIRRVLFFKNPLCHPTVMMRKDILLKVGGYFSFFAEDYAMWAFLALDKSVRFANIPMKLISYRVNHPEHPRNASWKSAKATVAGIQIQMFGMTHDPRWLIGAVVNILKTFMSTRQ